MDYVYLNKANLGWAVLASFFHILALVSTVLRLVHRLRTSRMWWDDYMVVLPLGLDTAYFASLWVLYDFQRKESTTLLPHTGISSFWASIFLFLSVVWLSRISIALSLTRVFPTFHKARLSAFLLAVICVLSYLCCVLVLTFECPSENASWYETVAPNCHKTGTTFVSRAVGSALDISVDSIFILFPIITLWRVKLPRNLRRIIISAFSGSALTLITAIVFCIIGYESNFNLGSDADTIIRLAAHLEAAVSLTVANLLVIVSFFYRTFRQVRDLEGAEHPIARKSPPSPATESEGNNGLGRETSIGQVSVLATEDRPLSYTLTHFSQLIWSSLRVSEPPCLLSPDMSAS